MSRISTPQKSYEKYLHPQSASIPLQKLHSASSSSEKLMSLHSATSSTTKLLAPNSPSISKVSLAIPQAIPHTTTRQSRSRLQSQDDRVLALSVTFTLALLLLIGVPLGAILPQKYVVQLPVNVLVPFYIYPNPGVWDRLYDAAVKHHDTNFTVVVNPDRGPGSAAWPSGVYVEAIQHLLKFSNVRAIGYIDTKRGARDDETVRKEIETYAGWNVSGIALQGIFFDHTPSHGVGNASAYLRNISAMVRERDRFVAPTLVVHNPGVVPNANLTGSHADVTVIYEGAYEDLPNKEAMSVALSGLDGRRENFAYIVNSMPESVRRGSIRKFVDAARRNVEWLYVTDRTGHDVYEEYSKHWEEFLDLTW